MSDTKEVPEAKDQDLPTSSGQEPLTPAGQSAMRGEHTGPEKPAATTGDEDSDLITTHHPQSPETLENKEIEPETQKIGQEGKIQPPPGWRPGGVESGG